MVKKANMLIRGSAFLRRNPNQPIQFRLAECRMGTKCNHEIQLARIVENIDKRVKQKGKRQGACMVRDEDEHFLRTKMDVQALVQRSEDRIIGEDLPRRCDEF